MFLTSYVDTQEIKNYQYLIDGMKMCPNIMLLYLANEHILRMCSGYKNLIRLMLGSLGGKAIYSFFAGSKAT